jgi:hypothetical protein
VSASARASARTRPAVSARRAGGLCTSAAHPRLAAEISRGIAGALRGIAILTRDNPDMAYWVDTVQDVARLINGKLADN